MSKQELRALIRALLTFDRTDAVVVTLVALLTLAALVWRDLQG